MTISSPDQAFRNLGNVWSSGLTLQTFEDESRALAFELTNSLLTAVSGKELEALEMTLKYIYWDLWGHIPHPKDPGAGWLVRRQNLQNEVGVNIQSLAAEEVEIGKQLIGSLNLLAETDVNYGRVILEALEQQPDTVFVVEKPRQRSELEALVSLHSVDPQYQIFNLGRFVSFPPSTFNQVVVLAAPRKLSDNFMRAIVLGGIASNYKFLAPNWLIGDDPASMRQELAPTLQVKPMPQIRVVGPLRAIAAKDVSLDSVEFSDYTSPSDIEKFISHGDIDSRHIHLNDGLVIPVEEDASRISTLERQEDGLLKVEFKNPFQNLLVGNVVFNLRDGAEDSFLLDLAAMEMGSEFRAFTSGRLAWKERAKSLIERDGLDGAVTHLKSKGVSTSHYLQDWIDDEDFVSPRAKIDWSNLLKALEFTAVEVKSLTALSTKVRSNLISIGQKARAAMADSIETTDWERLLAGQVVSKKLAEYGDAEFLLSTVTAIGNEVLKCHPNDIRKVRRL